MKPLLDDFFHYITSFQNFQDVKQALILLGILFGLCPMFKDWGSIILVAVLIASSYLLITYSAKQRIILLRRLVVLFVVRGAVWGSCMHMLESLFDHPVHEIVVSAQMYESLNPNGKGSYNGELMDEYRQMLRDNNEDFSKTHQEAMRILWEKITAAPEKMPALLLQKGRRAYCDDQDMMNWLLHNELDDEIERYAGLLDTVRSIDRLYYIGIVLLLIAAALSRSRYIYFILLIIVGAILAQLLIESQSRYKYSLEPVWCLAAAYPLCMFRFSVKKPNPIVKE